MILIISLISMYSFSQSTTTNPKGLDANYGVTNNNGQLKSPNLDNQNGATLKSGQLNSNTSNKKTSSNNLNLNFDKQLNVDAVNNQINNYTSNVNPNFLMENQPEDKDIIGVKYWNNQDITHQKLKSNFSLGTIKSATKTVRVECRDYSFVDGDIIKIYLNQQALENNVVLKAGNYSVYLELEEGYNRVDFQALNQGLSGPNTAELRLYDVNGNLISSNEWNLLTGETATLGVIFK
ncbi:hypothetical protein [Lutibacter sp. HS1-25]|uniref:hypothetical protein n=1 Tax=Lutibacter sp. HS1-25 TaxID=2485000 RepID=UPI001012D42E|nr:hypothetical protein [Lutibacter sp. HS1-25]